MPKEKNKYIKKHTNQNNIKYYKRECFYDTLFFVRLFLICTQAVELVVSALRLREWSVVHDDVQISCVACVLASHESVHRLTP